MLTLTSKIVCYDIPGKSVKHLSAAISFKNKQLKSHIKTRNLHVKSILTLEKSQTSFFSVVISDRSNILDFYKVPILH